MITPGNATSVNSLPVFWLQKAGRDVHDGVAGKGNLVLVRKVSRQIFLLTTKRPRPESDAVKRPQSPPIRLPAAEPDQTRIGVSTTDTESEKRSVSSVDNRAPGLPCVTAQQRQQRASGSEFAADSRGEGY